jgi:hypothetical protein
MKTLITLSLGFALGLYFADYRSVRYVKHQVTTAIATADKALR